ncbi:hypothetical protein AB0M72_27315 [Nocardiopsis dassonvillei]
MNLLRLLAELAAAMVRPARGRHRLHRPAPCAPRVPQQARRVYHGADAEAELLGRAHPAWRVVVIPDPDVGRWCYVATRAARTVRAASAEAVRRKMAAVDREPPPAFVRPYVWKAIP